MSKLRVIVLALLCVCVAPVYVAADAFDGSQPLVCATIKAIECSVEGECFHGTAESVNIPQFFKIDFNQKMISEIKQGGDKRSSKITHMDHLNGKVVLQGMGEHLAWSVAISGGTGKIVITASGDQVGFVVFGACTPL